MNNSIAKRKYFLTTGDFDQFDHIKPYAILNYFQDIASLHSWKLQAGYQHLLEKGKIWVLLKNKFIVYEQPQFFDEIEVTSWPLETNKIYYPRCYEMTNQNKKMIAKGMSQWAIINLEQNQIARDTWDLGISINKEALFSFTKKFSAPSQFIFAGKYIVRFSHLDHYNHMNNAVYANIISDALLACNITTINNMEIHYQKQAKWNDEIFVSYQLTDDAIYVVGTNASEAVFFTARMNASHFQ